MVTVVTTPGGEPSFNIQARALPDLQEVAPRAPAVVAPQSATQATLTVPAGASGVYVLSDGTQRVGLSAGATATEIQSALEGFASIGAGNVTVTDVTPA